MFGKKLMVIIQAEIFGMRYDYQLILAICYTNNKHAYIFDQYNKSSYLHSDKN
jgi:hypothetical protein